MALRLLLYSHDTFGLGNIRRNYLLARSIVERSSHARVLLLTSSRWFHLFASHPRIEFVKLPEIVRIERGGYEPRSSGVKIDPLVRARKEILLGAARGFRPDLMVVDKTPLGVGEELRPTLDWMRRKGRASALVLRDILDEPTWTRDAWRRTGQYDALSEYYRSVWVLGDPTVYATAQMYGIDETGVDVRYAGYLGRPGAVGADRVDGNGRVLVTVGGGEDGALLMERVAEALPDDGSIPADLVFGPYFPAVIRERITSRISSPQVRCVDYVDDIPRRIRRAKGVVSMGGYNTVCEILSAQVPALVVPRTRPAREQQIRAERMSSLGFFDAVDPDTATPETITAALRRMVDSGDRSWKRPNMDGVECVTGWALGV